MKRFVCLICVSLILVSASAQTTLGITTDKTTSLVSPSAIRHVDRGTRSVLAQQVKEMPTILLVKAAEKDFKETNLSVITEDGSVYSFIISFNSSPSSWVHYLPANKSATVASYAIAILDNPKTLKGIKNSRYDVSVMVSGIYIKNDVIYYQLAIENGSPIDYDIDLLRFIIKDQKQGKRTAVQEAEQKPLHEAGYTVKVKAYSNSAIVVALEKFTIPDKKYLAIQFNEKNGGRHLNLKVSNRKIMQAIILPDLK